MAEYLTLCNRFFLPRKLRFRNSFLTSISNLVSILTSEIIERSVKDFRQSKMLNSSLAFFLRDSLLLMDRTFVLQQVKYYNDVMVKEIK